MRGLEYEQNPNTERNLFHQHWETTNFFNWIICAFCPFSLELIEKFINLSQYIVVCETYEW